MNSTLNKIIQNIKKRVNQKRKEFGRIKWQGGKVYPAIQVNYTQMQQIGDKYELIRPILFSEDDYF